MTEWPAGDVAANGITLHYHRTGGGKPPVVLLHGITDNGLCWTRLAKALEGEYDLIMVDARGHGLSEAPESGYSPQDHAADVAGLIGALGLKQPVLIGHSMGAGTAAVCAGLYPQQVGGIVLEDPPWRLPALAKPEAGAAMLEQWRADIIANRAKSEQEIYAQGRAQSPAWDEAEFGPWVQSKRQVSPNVAGYISGIRSPWQETVRALCCPGLLITAEPARGAIITPEIAAEAVTLWPQGRAVNLPGAGHNIRREQFVPYLQAVKQFLAEHYGSRQNRAG